MKKRDLAILKSLQTFTFLSTEQICELHFSNLTYPRVNANRVLKRMRLRPNSEIAAVTDRSFQSYIYYLSDSKVKPNSQKRDHYAETVKTLNKPNMTVSQPIKSNGGITYRLE